MRQRLGKSVLGQDLRLQRATVILQAIDIHIAGVWQSVHSAAGLHVRRPKADTDGRPFLADKRSPADETERQVKKT